jgi:hypothetical protein
VICGEPIYDTSAPKARLYGRLITRFWVWIETRGRARGDAMCGFRLYPLAPTIALLERMEVASGMSFDIEMLVRLDWEGLAIESVPTRVIYPHDGVSHFRMLRDNLRISRTHTKLFFASFLAKPRQHWSRIDERGASWGLRLTSATARLLGRQAARLAMLPAVAWFFVTGREARRASRTYLSRLGERSTPPRPGTCGATCSPSRMPRSTRSPPGAARSSSRSSSTAPRSFRGCAREARRAVHRLAPRQPGDDPRAGGDRGARHRHRRGLHRPCAALRRHPRRRQSALCRQPFEVRDFGPQTAILLKERVERGEILVIVGDRTPAADNGRRAHAPFLGHDRAVSRRVRWCWATCSAARSIFSSA